MRERCSAGALHWQALSTVPQRRWLIAATALAGALPCLATAVAQPAPLLIWNVSASVPRGLYLVLGGSSPRRGDFAAAHLPIMMAALAAERRYLPRGVPLLKRVAGAAGDRVCERGRVLSIDGRNAATRRLRDSRGRPMPGWNGCVGLRVGQYLLLSPHGWSFDGRYFGITQDSEMIGRAKLLWSIEAVSF